MKGWSDCCLVWVRQLCPGRPSLHCSNIIDLLQKLHGSIEALSSLIDFIEPSKSRTSQKCSTASSRKLRLEVEAVGEYFGQNCQNLAEIQNVILWATVRLDPSLSCKLVTFPLWCVVCDVTWVTTAWHLSRLFWLPLETSSSGLFALRWHRWHSFYHLALFLSLGRNDVSLCLFALSNHYPHNLHTFYQPTI